tara:strand:- start:784 stop:1125 length:342 start_codon:yes stop_codon:yes gene_type:complete
MKIDITKLRPQHDCLVEERVDYHRENAIEEPIEVVVYGGETYLMDGHSRVFVALENGISELEAVRQEDLTGFYFEKGSFDRVRERGIDKVQQLTRFVTEEEFRKMVWDNSEEN